MDLLPPETFPAILGHLSEPDRIKMLRTCKKMREWLEKRQHIARAAFDAFKAGSLKDGWKRENDLTVRLDITENLHDRTIYRSETVHLHANGRISIRSYESVNFSEMMMRLPGFYTTRFFMPWFREMTPSPSRRFPRTQRIDEIRKRLLEASPTLV